MFTTIRWRCSYNYQQQGVLIHNGIAINLISTIDIYDKLVIARGKVKN
jgi:hypothetical protein